MKTNSDNPVPEKKTQPAPQHKTIPMGEGDVQSLINIKNYMLTKPMEEVEGGVAYLRSLISGIQNA